MILMKKPLILFILLTAALAVRAQVIRPMTARYSNPSVKGNIVYVSNNIITSAGTIGNIIQPGQHPVGAGKTWVIMMWHGPLEPQSWVTETGMKQPVSLPVVVVRSVPLLVISTSHLISGNQLPYLIRHYLAPLFLMWKGMTEWWYM